MMDIALVSVTAISLTMAFAMGVVAWRLIREERRRSDARVASLLTELERTRGAGDREAASPSRSRASIPQPHGVDDDLTASSHSASGLSTATVGSPVGLGRLLATVAAAALIVAVATIAILSRSDTPPASAVEQTTPVELLSLAHAKQGEYLAITGAVRNPTDGVERGRLSVMATVFDREGVLIGTGQTPLPVRTLAPGSETPFAISMPDADRINRYRISFAQDQTNVPHVDRRQTPGGTQTTSPAGEQP